MSREIDAQVALEVMGWTRPHHLAFWSCEGQRVAPMSWSPSIDIRAAFEVVEKMQSLGWDWEASCDHDKKCGIMYFRGRDSYGPLQTFEANDYDTLPEAICKAALAAIANVQKPAKEARKG